MSQIKFISVDGIGARLETEDGVVITVPLAAWKGLLDFRLMDLIRIQRFNRKHPNIADHKTTEDIVPSVVNYVASQEIKFEEI